MAITGGNPKPLTTNGATATKNIRASAPGSRCSTSVLVAECCSSGALLSRLGVVVVSMLAFFLSILGQCLADRMVGFLLFCGLTLRSAFSTHSRTNVPQTGSRPGEQAAK